MSSKTLTGKESLFLEMESRVPDHPIVLLSNTGMVNLSQGEGWKVGGLARAVSACEGSYIFLAICGAWDGLVVSCMFRRELVREGEVEWFFEVYKRALVAVGEGRVGEEGLWYDLPR